MTSQNLNTNLLLDRLKQKAVDSEKHLRTKHYQAIKFLESKGVRPGKIREHAAKIAAASFLASSLLLFSPTIKTYIPQLKFAKYASFSTIQLQEILKKELVKILPDKVTPLNSDQEEKINKLLKTIYGIDIYGKFYNEKLNASYGYIGAEQHLLRFPGDNLSLHDENQEAGIAPGKGAWGYFSNNSNKLTPEEKNKEKYYVAVQTLYLPDWKIRVKFLANWYKHRKVVLINPKNGKVIVCVIADSGPANWTNKQFGGSPETMAYLQMKDGAQKGPVVLFFLDDPENQIPLGPMEYNVLLNKSKAI